MAVYAAMVEGMDQAIGRLVSSLREHGELSNEGNAALIEGDWKRVGQKVISRDQVIRDGKWTLHHLPTDLGERHDRSAAEPARTTRMLQTLEREARRTLVLPAP